MNAKEEFVELVKDFTVVAADITYEPNYDNQIPIRLKAGHTQADYEHFLRQLDFEYDNSYGHQFLYGTIWFLENCWAERGEYDGSEWWSMCTRPELPDYLQAT